MVMSLAVSLVRKSLLSASLVTEDKNIVLLTVVHLVMSFREKLPDKNLKKQLRRNLIIVIEADVTDNH